MGVGCEIDNSLYDNICIRNYIPIERHNICIFIIDYNILLHLYYSFIIMAEGRYTSHVVS